jgi:hypothetical protein
MGVLDSSSLASTKTSSALWLSFENLRDLVLFCDLLADTGVEPTTRELFRAAGPVSRSGFRECLATLGDSNRAERLSSEARADGVFSASCLCIVSWPGESKKSVAFFRVLGILNKRVVMIDRPWPNFRCKNFENQAAHFQIKAPKIFCDCKAMLTLLY